MFAPLGVTVLALTTELNEAGEHVVMLPPVDVQNATTTLPVANAVAGVVVSNRAVPEVQ